MSLTTAASMIEDYVSQGVAVEDIGLTDSEIEILDIENKMIVVKLRKMAVKLDKS